MGAPDARHVEHVTGTLGRRAAHGTEPAKPQLRSGPLQQHAGRPAILPAQKREGTIARDGDEVAFRDDHRAATESREHIWTVELSVEPMQRFLIGGEVERVCVPSREPRCLTLDRAREHPLGIGRRQAQLLSHPGREAVLRTSRREHSPERRQVREHDRSFGAVRAQSFHRARNVAIARQAMARMLARLVHHESHEIVAIDAAADVARANLRPVSVDPARELGDDWRRSAGEQAEMLG